MCTMLTPTTPTFITEVHRLVTYVQLFLNDLKCELTVYTIITVLAYSY